MFVYGAEFFLFKPGLVLLVARAAAHAAAELRPDHIGAVTFGLYWMLLGVDALGHRAAELLLRLSGPGAL